MLMADLLQVVWKTKTNELAKNKSQVKLNRWGMYSQHDEVRHAIWLKSRLQTSREVEFAVIHDYKKGKYVIGEVKGLCPRSVEFKTVVYTNMKHLKKKSVSFTDVTKTHTSIKLIHKKEAEKLVEKLVLAEAL